jgi:hypothetical protein
MTRKNIAERRLDSNEKENKILTNLLYNALRLFYCVQLFDLINSDITEYSVNMYIYIYICM